MKSTQRILNRLNNTFLNNIGFDLQRHRYDAVPKDDYLGQHGVDLLTDISNTINTTTPTILDVGSFRGHSIRVFRHIWPDSVITAFEPSLASSAILHNHWDSVPGVQIVDSAVFDATSTIQLPKPTSNTSTSIFESRVYSERDNISTSSPMVPTVSLTQYCTSCSIEYVDLLNIATRGSQLQIIQGAKEMLTEGAIHLVVIELTFDPTYKDGARPSAVFSLLESLGYVCKGIFNQAGRSGHLERADGLWRKFE